MILDTHMYHFFVLLISYSYTPSEQIHNTPLIIVFIFFHSALLSVTDKERLLKEVSIMLSFTHPNVMPLTGLSIDGEMPLLIMPFMTNGSVLEYVKQHREKIYFLENTNDLEVRITSMIMLFIILLVILTS